MARHAGRLIEMGACHVCHYRSKVDDADQPYIVSGPAAGPPGSKLACLVVLHDELRTAERETFVDQGLETAARWRKALEQSPIPTLMVQPFGRGNASWLGLGGRDLFDVLESVQTEYPIDGERTYLAGVGAGGTGALQLAAWYPDRWAAVACCAPAVDDRIDHRAGLIPDWEEPNRESLRTLSLVRNLVDIPLLLERPWWADGLAGATHWDHMAGLLDSLEKAGCPFELVQQRPLVPTVEPWPTDPEVVLRWLLAHKRRRNTRKWEHATFSSRSCREGVRIERIEDPGKPSTIRMESNDSEIRIRTTGVADLAVCVSPASVVRIDKDRFLGPSLMEASDTAGWVRFERLAESWSIADPPNGSKGATCVKSSRLPGPISDMRWDGVVFSPGTLGDDFENRTMLRLAESLRDSWQYGKDSPSLHPGDATTVVNYAIVPDAELTDSIARRRHIVAIGTPRTNLLLARNRGSLGCTWPGAAADATMLEPFRVAGKLYNGPRDGLFLLGPNPDVPDRYVLVVTATTIDGLAKAVLFPTAYMPDYLVYRDNGVRAWGRCGADWKP